jgi:glycosyltransferase involved in cell wall biosynthesis
MKILHIIPYIDPKYGGPSVVVQDMAQASKVKGNEVHIATTYDPFSCSSIINDESSIKAGIFIHKFKNTFPHSWFRSITMKNWLLKNILEFDLLHLHVPFTGPFFYGANSALISGRPYVVTLHGVLDPWSLQQKTWKKIPYFYLIDRNILNQAKFLHVTSKSERDNITKLKIKADIRLIRPCVPVINIDRENVSSDEEIRILCIARLDPVKAHKVLFEAVAKLIDQGLKIVLDIAGDGRSYYKEELKSYVNKLGLDNYVFWHGHVDAEKKLILYANAWCFALISFHESFGLAAAEAMAAGLPVVVTDQVGLAEDVKAYSAGFVVETNDPHAVADAFKKLLNIKEVKACSNQALKLACELYNRKIFTDDLNNLYLDAINS